MRASMSVLFIGLIVIGLVGLQRGAAQTPPTLEERMAAAETRIALHDILLGLVTPTAPTAPATATATLAPTPTPVPPTATVVPSSTPVPSPTPSPVPPSVTPTVASGWHPAGAHDGLNVHEHGLVSPPAWVLASGHPPFTQTRESHVGYKAVLDTSPGGVESYFIGHILSTEMARSHGDHDYQLWLRDPETGAVTYYAGMMDFAVDPNNHMSPIPESAVDDPSIRPVAQSVGDAGCETWYTRPGSTVMDVGWTMCGRYQSFDGTVRGGTGTFRTVDWIIPCNRLPAGSPLLDNCRVEFGVNRLSFLVSSIENDPAGVVRPIN